MLNCVDLFAGAGGFTLAAQNAGFDVRVAIENDPHAANTYRKNFCSGPSRPHLVETDIELVDAAELAASIFDDTNVCDLILGGPPCQGFSTHRIKGAGIGDKRNDLIHAYFNFVCAFSPSAFLMENVPGMLWDRHSEYLDRFYEEGAQAGYNIAPPIIVDARDYGIPQRRKRVFILGTRSDIDATPLVWPPPNTHGDYTSREKNSKLLPWVNCNDVFRPAPKNDPNNIHMCHGPELIEAFRNTPSNGGSRKDSGRVLKCHKKHDGHKDVYGRINPNLPAPTMTTACINPSKGRFVHPIEHHGITIRQAARIQTFPDEFCFSGGLTAAGKQIGNAVPIDLGTLLLRQIKSLLNEARNQLEKKPKTIERSKVEFV